MPEARVLLVSTKVESIYRRHCNPAVCKVSITALRRAPQDEMLTRAGSFYKSAAETRMEKNLQASQTWSFGILTQAIHANSETQDHDHSSPGQSGFILSPPPAVFQHGIDQPWRLSL